MKEWSAEEWQPRRCLVRKRLIFARLTVKGLGRNITFSPAKMASYILVKSPNSWCPLGVSFAGVWLHPPD